MPRGAEYSIWLTKPATELRYYGYRFPMKWHYGGWQGILVPEKPWIKNNPILAAQDERAGHLKHYDW